MNLKIVLSPMAGVNDKIFRELCISMGADMAFTEMISVNGLTSNNFKSFEMIPENGEKHVVQLFGRDPELFLKSAEIVRNKNGSNWIDINAGCPVKKVTKRGYGSALMEEPKRIRSIVELLSKNGFKVSIKIRLGREKNKNYLEVAKAASDGGAFLVSIHGRTVEQGYNGKANWESAKVLKEALQGVKVGISGDIFTYLDAYRAINQTKADFLLIARGAIGNPWIFKSVREYFRSQKVIHVDLSEKKRVFNLHLDKTIKEYGIHGIIFFRKFVVAYLKGLPNSHETKLEALKESSVEGLKRVVNGFFDKLISCEQGGVERGNIKS
ncbi:tRNA dihydrouridine synthase [Mesoaciditoga sp.]